MPLSTSHCFLLFLGIAFVVSCEGRAEKSAEQEPRKGYYLKPNITFAGAKEEFQQEFGGFAKSMLCSGCKLTAARWSEELAKRPVLASSNGVQAYDAMEQVLNETCNNLPDPLVGVGGSGGPEFVAYDVVASVDPDLAAQAKPNAVRSRQMAHRLCLGLMRDFVRDLLIELTAKFSGQPVAWERLLCARRAKLCKRSEVQDDDDEVSEGQVTDSVEKKRQASALKKRRKHLEKLFDAAVAKDKSKFEAVLTELHEGGDLHEVPPLIDAVLAALWQEDQLDSGDEL